MLNTIKKFLMYILDWIWVTINPMFWIANEKTSNVTDVIIRDLINSNAKITNVRSCTLRLNNIEVWVANYPYSYGNITGGDFASNKIPSKVTRLRLWRYVNRFTKQLAKEKEIMLIEKYMKGKANDS